LISRLTKALPNVSLAWFIFSGLLISLLLKWNDVTLVFVKQIQSQKHIEQQTGSYFRPLIKKIFSDETNMFANDVQTPMKTADMEFHPTLT